MNIREGNAGVVAEIKSCKLCDARNAFNAGIRNIHAVRELKYFQVLASIANALHDAVINITRRMWNTE